MMHYSVTDLTNSFIPSLFFHSCLPPMNVVLEFSRLQRGGWRQSAFYQKCFYFYFSPFCTLFWCFFHFKTMKKSDQSLLEKAARQSRVTSNLPLTSLSSFYLKPQTCQNCVYCLFCSREGFHVAERICSHPMLSSLFL